MNGYHQGFITNNLGACVLMVNNKIVGCGKKKDEPAGPELFLYTDYQEGNTTDLCSVIDRNLSGNIRIPEINSFGKTIISINGNNLPYSTNPAFLKCQNITDVTLPNTIINIGNESFYGCSNLSAITLSQSLTSIGERCFYNCSKLKNIQLPDSLTEIKSSAFQRCSELTSISIPDKVTMISMSTFSYCSSLETIELKEGLNVISVNAFTYCTKLTSIVIPESVSEIGQGAFVGCTNLKDITFTNKTESMIKQMKDYDLWYLPNDAVIHSTDSDFIYKQI